MEDMVNSALFGGIYKGKRVLVTGHTGFKGSWLCLWLNSLGAHVHGFALAPSAPLNHFDLLRLPMDSVIGDLRDFEALERCFQKARPEIVFHLAAQPLVRESYVNPVVTYETNVMGTVNVLEACRHTEALKAVVIISSDKCYENREWAWGYRENDPMGGYDPYSSSKGCAELVTSAYRNSFFNPEAYEDTPCPLVASARAGNVIGGGDWSADRLVPDVVKAAAAGGKAVIRAPRSTRPWQHVLDPLSGYLLLGQRLLEGVAAFARGWNFGPDSCRTTSVGDLLEAMAGHWDRISYETEGDSGPHEAGLLQLDSSLACKVLGWRSVWGVRTSVRKTIEWYRRHYEGGQLASAEDIEAYVTKARADGVHWATL